MVTTPAKDFLTRRLVAVELAAFMVVVVLIWLDEIIDIPFLVFGAAATPVNWRESLFETALIAPICLMIVYYTRVMVKKLKYLEGFLPICASCKKIRDDAGNWQQMEEYIGDRSEAKFSHGICPSCAKKLYPDLILDPDRLRGQGKPSSKAT
ncbi:MAG: hypothetical protein ACD_75C02577G0003 [uncultured bacterium]|nr:MAG: hypothetical protein ACD_75C02577G0003 [uncultured bacterium]